MKRRALLGTIATTAVAGCTGVLGDADETTTTDDPTTDPSRDPDGFNYLLDAVRTDPVPVPDVTIDVTVTQNFTETHPAALRVAFTNDADRAREFGFGSLIPWDDLRGERVDADGTLLLAPGTDVVPASPTDDCWRATDGVALPMVMQTPTLAPGETRSREYRVLAAHDSESCHEQGTYRFEDDSFLGEGWGFEVDVVPVVYDAGE